MNPSKGYKVTSIPNKYEIIRTKTREMRSKCFRVVFVPSHCMSQKVFFLSFGGGNCRKNSKKTLLAPKIVRWTFMDE